ncbi:MAG: hypothetical protein J6A48_07060 [Clostridia bacterium]|nr:hypothetical protein [Clostridia bacterium]
MRNPEIEYLKKLTRAFIRADEAAKVLGCNPNSIRQAARLRPELLGFPVVILGNHVKIPRIPFLNLMTGGTNE